MGVLVFNPADGRLARKDGEKESVALRPQAAMLLQLLLVQRGQVVSRASLISAIWDDGRVVDYEAGLAALISELRSAMEALAPGSGKWVETIPRRGLRLSVPEMDPPYQSSVGGEYKARHQAIKYWVVGVVSALMVAALLLTINWQAPPSEATGLEAGGTVAILPFQSLGASASEARFDLIAADRFLGSLWSARLEGVSILGRASVQPYASRDDLISALAADLGVNWVVEGSITLGTDRQGVLEARLLTVPGGQVVWSETLLVGDEGQPSVGEGAGKLAEHLASVWRSAMRGN